MDKKDLIYSFMLWNTSVLLLENYWQILHKGSKVNFKLEWR